MLYLLVLLEYTYYPNALGGLYVAASLGAHVAVFGGLALVGLAAVAASWMVRARWRAVSAPMRFRVVVVGLISYGVILALLAVFLVFSSPCKSYILDIQLECQPMLLVLLLLHVRYLSFLVFYRQSLEKYEN